MVFEVRVEVIRMWICLNFQTYLLPSLFTLLPIPQIFYPKDHIIRQRNIKKPSRVDIKGASRFSTNKSSNLLLFLISKSLQISST